MGIIIMILSHISSFTLLIALNAAHNFFKALKHPNEPFLEHISDIFPKFMERGERFFQTCLNSVFRQLFFQILLDGLLRSDQQCDLILDKIRR